MSYQDTLIRKMAFTHKGERVIAVVSWGRDCDNCESTSIRTMPATIEAFEAFEEMVYDNAEGACSVEIVSQSEAAEFSPRFIDHAAIAENY